MRIALAMLLAVSALCAADARAAPVRLAAPRKLLQVARNVNTPEWASQQLAVLTEQGPAGDDAQRGAAPAAAQPAEPHPGNSGWSALYPGVPGNTNRAWRASTILWPGRAAPATAAPAQGGRLGEDTPARQQPARSAVDEREEYPWAGKGPGGRDAPLYWR